MSELDRIRQRQAGVVTRAQLLDDGVTRTELAKALRRGELVVVHPGVYVAHNGTLSWLERAWAAVLWASPAVLSHDSAKRAFDRRGFDQQDTAPIHLLVERHRHLHTRPGIRLHRSAHYDTRVQANLSPPRVRYEETILDLAADAASDLDAIAVLADACGSRRTSAARLLEALDARPWTPRRAWMHGVLTDVATGTCSVLEHGYLDLVERAHGLPVGTRQAPVANGGRTMWQDVRYDPWKVGVELDGQLFHTSTQDRDADLERDLDSAVEREQTTLRLGYGQVFRRACTTAVKVGAVLARLGWPGQVQPCENCGGQDQAA